MTASVLLPSGHVALVDDDDLALVSAYKWSVLRSGTTTTTYAQAGRGVLMHRLIAGVLDAGRHAVVDHVNHNGLDNRRANLRVVTASANGRNRRGAQGNSSTGVLGVSPAGGRYGVWIKTDDVRVWVGSYPTVTEGAIARNAYLDEHDLDHTRSDVAAARAYDAYPLEVAA